MRQRKKLDVVQKKSHVEMMTTQNANPANHLIFPEGQPPSQHLRQNQNHRQVARKGAQKVTFILR